MRASTSGLVLTPDRVLARWAGVSLALTVLVGLWLRAAMRWPALAGGASLPNAMHAHSHVGFFGWAVLALGAVAAARAGATGGQAHALRVVGHVLGAGSVVALAAFAWQGYGAASIAVSAVHVLLWVVLAALVWPMRAARPTERRLWRTALAVLVCAGAATVLPVVLRARGIESGWLRDAGIKLFLTTFVHGWIGIGTMAVVARRLPHTRATRHALRAAALLVAVATPLTTPLHVAGDPPAEWLPGMARCAVALVGVGTLILGVRLVVARAGWLLRGAGAWATTAGALQLAAAAGVGASLVHARAVTVAYLHLLLLGVATPVLVDALALTRARRARPGAALALHGALGAMLVAVAAMGWPWLGARLGAVGLDAMRLLAIAALAGGAWIAALVAVVAAARPRRPRVRDADGRVVGAAAARPAPVLAGRAAQSLTSRHP